MAIQALIFDVDGLLVDSEPLARRAWGAFLARYGHTLDQATLDSVLGMRLIDTAALMRERFSLPLPIEAIMAGKNEIFFDLARTELQPMPGGQELWNAIGQRGLGRALATSAEPEYVPLALQSAQLVPEPDAIVTGRDVEHGKPSPDIYLAAACALEVSPERCLALEDAPNGIEAAKAAGMRCIAIPNEATASLDLGAADWVLPSLATVAGRLDEFLES